MILTRLHRPDEDLPKELRDEFKAVYHDLTKETATGEEGNIAARMRKVNSEEAAKLAHRIFSLYV
jgi:hypothetical protein